MGTVSYTHLDVYKRHLISHQILFTMSGKGKIIVGDKEYTAGKGSIFYIASGESHTYLSLIHI